MARIARKTAKIFGDTAGTDQIAQFGSLADATPNFTTDPAVIQALAQYDQGWFGAVLGGNSPAIEDMNAIHYLYAYQIAYVLQVGVGEWDVGTTYYIGDIVSNGTGALYVSQQDTNLNHALSLTAWWRPYLNTTQEIYTVNTNWTCPANVNVIRISARRKASLLALAGSPTSCLIAVNPFGTLYGWGPNVSGQIGDSTVIGKSSATILTGSGTNQWSQISVMKGNATCYALNGYGFAYGWGDNTNGQIGDGTVIPKSSPTLVSAAGLTPFQKIVAAGDSVYGLTPGGLIYAWGKNENGQLGLGDVVPRSVPTLITGLVGMVDVIADGDSNQNSCFALTAGGDCYAWGNNSSGELGLGDVVPRSAPSLVVGSHVISKVSFAANSIFGGETTLLTTAGIMYSMGSNEQGCLGTGNTNPASTPTLVVGVAGLSFTKVIQTGTNAYALLSDGTMYGWGDNSEGQVGDGTIVAKSSPVLVVGGKKFQTFVAGTRSLTVNALDKTGTLYGWGDNDLGAVGDGTILARSSPVAVAGVSGIVFSKIFQGGTSANTFNLAATAQGKIYAWGYNTGGQLSDGTNAAKSSAVATVGTLGIMDVSETVYENEISVIPGQTYVINVNGYFPSFGMTPIGKSKCSEVVLSYEQR